MATSDVWELVMRTNIQSQDCLNVFFYRGMTGVTITPSEVIDAFHAQVVPMVSGVVATDVVLEDIRCRKLFDPATPTLTLYGETLGPGAGDSLPSFNAYSFTFNVGTNVTRPGHKRIPGPYEAGQTDGAISSSLITPVNDLAAAMAAPLVDTTVGLVDWAIPVIVKRILDGSSYRLPTSAGELVLNIVTGVVGSLLLSSQSSRKQRITI